MQLGAVGKMIADTSDTYSTWVKCGTAHFHLVYSSKKGACPVRKLCFVPPSGMLGGDPSAISWFMLVYNPQ